ncbi:hypothetical protein FACS1894123_03970 [Bacteroidia bacterium]|nr:hypothetical protein FACS1894123_03970 [Bacteroidia bacterium]
MSKKNGYIVCLLLGFYLLGCNKTTITPDLGYPIVDIDLNRAEKVNFGDWIDSVQFIPLESNKNSIIGLYGKMLNVDNKYYITDRLGPSPFLIFDSIGNFIFRNIAGSGPNEYKSITSFNIDIETGNIIIYDFFDAKKKLKEYDNKFNLLKDIPLPTYMPWSNFKKITDDIYLFGSLRGEKELVNVFSVKEGEIIKKLYPLPEAEAKELIDTERYSFFSSNDCSYFTPIFPHPELYRFDTITMDLVKDIVYTIGGKEFSVNKLPTGQSKSYYKDLLLSPRGPNGKWNDNYAYVWNKWKMGDCYYARIYHKEKMYINRFDKKNGKHRTILAQFNDGGMINQPVYVDNEAIYYLALPEDIKDLVGEKHIDSKYKAMLDKAIEEDDNFWIVKYYMKK